MPDKQFSLTKIPLKTVRPFVISDIVLADQKGVRLNDEKRLNAFLTEKVNLSLSPNLPIDSFLT
jgi:double-strand break repair protein MRE11